MCWSGVSSDKNAHSVETVCRLLGNMQWNQGGEVKEYEPLYFCFLAPHRCHFTGSLPFRAFHPWRVSCTRLSSPSRQSFKWPRRSHTSSFPAKTPSGDSH